MTNPAPKDKQKPLQLSRLSLLEAARDYNRRGWTVLPIRAGSKLSAVPWKRYQTQHPAQRLVDRWFASEGISGLAVIAGSASDGLAIRDFDTEDAYYQWASTHCDLAGILPTVKTHRGYHVYCTSPAEMFADLPDGEFRADNTHYCLLPPSLDSTTHSRTPPVRPYLSGSTPSQTPAP